MHLHVPDSPGEEKWPNPKILDYGILELEILRDPVISL